MKEKEQKRFWKRLLAAILTVILLIPGGGMDTVKADDAGTSSTATETSAVEEVVVAPLVDKNTDNEQLLTTLYDKDSYKAEVKGKTVSGNVTTVSVKVDAKNLRKHINDPQNAGYWIGVGILTSLTSNDDGYTLSGNSDIYHDWVKPDVETTSFSGNSKDIMTPDFPNEAPKYSSFYFDAKEIETGKKTAYIALKYTKKAESAETETPEPKYVIYEIDFSGVTLYHPTLSSLAITYTSPDAATATTKTFTGVDLTSGKSLLTMHPGETVSQIVATMSEDVSSATTNELKLSAAVKILGETIKNDDYGTITISGGDSNIITIVPKGGSGTCGADGQVVFDFAEGLLKNVYGETNQKLSFTITVKEETFSTPTTLKITKAGVRTPVEAEIAKGVTMSVGDEVTSVTADFSSQPVAVVTGNEKNVKVKVGTGAEETYGTISTADGGKTVIITPDTNRGKCGVEGTVTFTIPEGTLVTKKTAGLESKYQLTNDKITFTLTVQPAVIAVTSVTLDWTRKAIYVGDTVSMNATVKPDDATDKSVTFSSNNPAVATVSGNMVTGVSAGTATIIATAGGKTATATVTVQNVEVSEITVSPTSVEVMETLTTRVYATVKPDNATIKTVTWTSNNPRIATVDEDGVITGVSVGETKVIAKAGTKTAEVAVSVTENTIEVDTFYLDETNISFSLEEADTYPIYAYVFPTNAKDRKVTWTSANPKVATVTDKTVDPNEYFIGSVSPVGVGYTTVTATCGKFSESVLIRVYETTAEADAGNSSEQDETLLKDITTVSGEIKLEEVAAAVAPQGENTRIWIGGLDSAYTYTGSAIKPEIHVYDGLKQLTEGSDYTVSYKNNTNAAKSNASKAPSVTVKFKGNYKGTASQTVTFEIQKADFAELFTANDLAVKVTSKAQKPVPTVVWKSTGKTFAKKNYTVAYKGVSNNNIIVKDANTYTATITPKDTKNLTGTISAKVTLTDDASKNLANAKVTLKRTKITWTGSAITLADSEIEVKDSKGVVIDLTRVDGKKNYQVEYKNNTNVGTASLTIVGNGTDFFGSKTVTFKIVKGKSVSTNQIIFDDESLQTTGKDSFAYQKGGVKPKVLVYEDLDEDGDAIPLTLGKDYTVTYKNYKAVTNSAKATVKGKGNYSFEKVLYYKITPASLNANVTVYASDKAYKNKKNNFKNPTIVVYDDNNHKKLSSSDYSISTYSVSNNSIAAVGTSVTVTIRAKSSNYTGTATGEYTIIDGSKDLSKAKVAKSISNRKYTGNAIYLTKEELNGLLYFGKDKTKTLSYGTDYSRYSDYEDDDEDVYTYPGYLTTGTYTITLYGTKRVLQKTVTQNNGTTKVVDDYSQYYSGYKTITFKVVSKTGSWKSGGSALREDGTWN